MNKKYLVTIVLKEIALPIGYYTKEEAEMIKEQIIETHIANDKIESVIIA